VDPLGAAHDHAPEAARVSDGPPVDSLPGFLAELVASYAALFVYGWLVALIVARNRLLATAISAAFLALYSLLLLYHWHTRGQFEWGVLWRFRREMLDLEVRRTISSFLGWRSYVFPVAAIAAAVVLELAGRVMSRPPRPRRRGPRPARQPRGRRVRRAGAGSDRVTS
jgi:hypothetical protein